MLILVTPGGGWWLGCALDPSSDAGGLHPSAAGARVVPGMPAGWAA